VYRLREEGGLSTAGLKLLSGLEYEMNRVADVSSELLRSSHFPPDAKIPVESGHGISDLDELLEA
jgi:hypothetical protein